MSIYILILALLVCLVCGFLVGRHSMKLKPVGTLRVDCSDEDGPYLFLELEEGVHEIMNDTHVVLYVKVENFLPQE